MATQVATLLAQARAAHNAKKQAAGRAGAGGVILEHPDYPKAEACIREAIRLREQAHEIDPTQSDAAWSEDLAANKNVSSVALLAWFKGYLDIP